MRSTFPLTPSGESPQKQSVLLHSQAAHMLPDLFSTTERAPARLGEPSA